MFTIAFLTATHASVSGEFESLPAAIEAYEARRDFYERRAGKVVEGSTEDAKAANEQEALYP